MRREGYTLWGHVYDDVRRKYNPLDRCLLPLTLMSVRILRLALRTGLNAALYTGKFATSFPRTTRLEQALIHLFLWMR